MTRTRKDIVAAIRHGMGVSRHDAGAARETVLKVIKDTLASKSIPGIRTWRAAEKRGYPLPKYKGGWDIHD